MEGERLHTLCNSALALSLHRAWVRKKMSCLPTQIYLEACHISVWGVNSQEDGRVQTSCE